MGGRSVVAGFKVALLLAGAPIAVHAANAQSAMDSASPLRSIELRSSAGQDVAAARGETVELMFADGTIITLAAGSRAEIRRYSWDQSVGAGVLEIDLLAGLARIATGRLDSANGMTLRAGGTDVKLTNAIAFIDMRSGTPVVALLAGKGAEVSIAGQTRRIERPGFAVALAGEVPGPVRRFPAAALRGAIEALNPGLVGGTGGGGSTLADSGDPEDTARDLRGGLQQASLDLGPAAARGGAGLIRLGSAPLLSIAGEPIFDPDQPTINNAAIVRGPAAQNISQHQAFSPARGQACANTSGAIACSQTQSNLFRTFQGSAGEQQRATGATISVIGTIDGKSGPSVLQAVSRNGLPLTGQSRNSIYTFALDRFRQPDVSGEFDITIEELVPVLAIFDPISESLDNDFGPILGNSDIFDDDGNPLGTASVQSKQASVDDFGGPTSFKFRLDILLNPNGTQISFQSKTDGLAFSGLVIPSIPTVNEQDRFQNTPFGAGLVSLVQSGFRGFRGVADDKTVTQSPPLQFVDFSLVDRLSDNFLAIQIDEVTDGSNVSICASTVCSGFAYFFATGDMAERFGTDRFSVDQFYLTPGLTGYGQTDKPASARAIFAGSVIGSLGPEDAIAYALTPATGDTARFAQADFTYNVDSGRVTGLTIGAAIGDLGYTDLYDADGNPTLDSPVTQEPGRRQLVSELGRALGANDGGGANGVIYRADLTVTASGGGNPNLRQIGADDRATATQAQGRAGYIVLDARPPGSDESMLRLAQGIATQGLAELDRSGGAFNGFLAGIAQIGGAGEVSWLDSRGSDDFSLRIEGGVVTATVAPRTLTDAPIGTFTLGGAENGAFISRDRFLAFTPTGSDANAALVSSDFLKPFQGPGDPLADFDAAVPDYARWGAFLGDLIAAKPSTQIMTFVPWVAAPRVPQSALPVSGSASYSGAVLGNVAVPSVSQTQTYTAGGAFTHDWSFAQRRGNFSMQFDQRDYAAFTAATANGFEFAGQLRRSGGRTQVGGVTGAFVSPTIDRASTTPPTGTIGQFMINDRGTYVAAGVFAGRAN